MPALHTVTAEIASEDGRVLREHLTGAAVVIGRGANADIQLTDDTVSRRHAQLVRDPFGRWWIRDLGSRNGIRVRGQRVPEHVLEPGEWVQLGNFRLRLVPQTFDETIAVPVGTAHLSDAGPEQLSTLSEQEPAKVTSAHLQKLMELGRQLLEQPDHAQRIRQLCAWFASPTVRGYWAAVLRLPPSGVESAPEVLAYSSEKLQPLHISRTLIRKVADVNRAVIASNAPIGPVDAQLSIDSQATKVAAIACPLRSEPGVREILYVLLPPDCGTQEWLVMSSLAVEQYRQASEIWSARKLSVDYAALDNELKRAAEIHQRLIPAPPAIPGLDVALSCRPCRWVGGDYVDVVQLADGSLLLVVADVCGKGLQAALVTAQLHAAVHLIAGQTTSLGPLVSRIDNYMRDRLPVWSFLTLAAVLLSPSMDRFEVANAGHPPALLVRSTGECEPLACAVNFPLGTGPQEFQVQSGSIAPSEGLFLYTDGVTDIFNEEGHILGMEGMQQRLRSCWKTTAGAADFAQHLDVDLDSAQGKTLQSDDRTWLLIRRSERTHPSVVVSTHAVGHAMVNR